MAGGKLTTISLGGCRVTLLPTVKGLDRERRKVHEAFDAVRPGAVALPVSREGLRGLRAIYRGKQPEIFLSHYEQIYAMKLARYGKVVVPPPSFTEAYALASERGLPIIAIDMNETDYANAFCDSISTPGLVFHSVRWRWLRRKRFRDAANARQFVLAWDRAVNSLKGFRNLEDRREEHMARRLLFLSKGYQNVLAVIELERMDGVLRRLSSGGLAPLGEDEAGSEEE